MSRSYWNESKSWSDDKGRAAEEEDNVSRRYYPAVEPAPLKPPPYYSNVARFSEHVACTKKPPPPQTAQSKEYTSDSQPKDPSSSMIKAVGSSSSAETIATSPSSSDSSFFESLRAESASCCPLCGFQAIPKNASSSSKNSGRVSLKAAALASSTNSDLPPSVWLRSLVAKQQEDLLKRCHSMESSSCVTSSITDASTCFPNQELPSGTCWVCIDAANKAAKEKQVEEDRLLAASLSKILLEEQQNPSNGSHVCDDTVGIHHQMMSISDYPVPHNTATQYQEQQEILQQEWSGQGHTPMVTVPTSVVVREGQDCNFQISEISSNANDDSCVFIGEYNVLGQRDGHGELIWDNGDRYVGTFQNGMRSGQGAFFFRDGSEYTGDWKDDLIHGIGQHKFANGDIYVGKYHKGQRSGEQCKYKFANSDLYVGGWEKDKFHGFGRYFYADGSVLEGNYCHGIKQGKFKRQLPTEDLDILRFEDDKIVGQGVRWNTKRTKTWLLEPRSSANDTGTEKSKARSTALRVVRGIASLKLSRHRRKKPNKNVPSSVGTLENISMLKEKDGNQTSSKSAPPLHGSPVPVSPQESTKNLVKKSVRIPISQAVSVGYDCEIGTGKQNVTTAVTVE